MKKRVARLIKAPFKLRWLEFVLRKIVHITGTNNFLIHFIPTHDMYSLGENRTSKVYGFHYVLDLSSYNNWSIYWRITSERQPKLLICKLLNENDIILDVGAHIGEVTMLMAKSAKKGKVMAIEGYPGTFNKLKQHIRINKIENVILVNKAVGDHEGHVFFEVILDNAGSNRISETPLSTEDTVEMSTIDAIFEASGLTRIDFIKMDIEGYEIKALNGACQVIEKFKPLLFVEVSDAPLKKNGSSAGDLFLLLKKMGYQNFIDVRTSKTLNESSDFHEMHTDILASFN